MNHSGRKAYLPDAWSLEVTKRAETQEGLEHLLEQPSIGTTLVVARVAARQDTGPCASRASSKDSHLRPQEH